MSNGNPGWINTMMISLKQSGLLRIVRMGSFEAQAKGYVFCEGNYLLRTSTRSTMSLRLSNSDWDLFETCCDDDQFLPFAHSNFSTKLVDVACLKGSIDALHYVPATSQDAFLLMLYDSLSSYEQYVCKCAAVLGEKFLRAALMFVIAQDNERDVAVGKWHRSRVSVSIADSRSHDHTQPSKNYLTFGYCPAPSGTLAQGSACTSGM